MKKLILITSLVGLLATPALANVTTMDCLGWWEEGDPGSTHQFWDFTDPYVTDEGPPWTALPEEIYNPSFAEATITADNYSPSDQFTDDTAIDVWLKIENYDILNAYKEIWVDVDFEGTLSGIRAEAHDGIWEDFSVVTLIDSGPSGEADFGFKIIPNPYIEDIYFTIDAPAAGGNAVLRYIHADTICIPAPGAILLGGIGVCLVGWLRRRRML